VTSGGTNFTIEHELVLHLGVRTLRTSYVYTTELQSRYIRYTKLLFRFAKHSSQVLILC